MRKNFIYIVAGIIAGAALLWQVFRWSDAAGVVETESPGEVVSKWIRPPSSTPISGGNRIVTPQAFIMNLRINGEELSCEAPSGPYFALEAGARTRVRYRRGRFSGRLYNVRVMEEGGGNP